MPNELRAPRRVIAKSRDRFLPILLVVILLSIVMTIVLRHLAEQYPEAVSSAPGGEARSQLAPQARAPSAATPRSEEHTSELQSLMRISYAVFCLKKKNKRNH